MMVKRGTSEPGKLQSGDTSDPDLETGSGKASRVNSNQARQAVLGIGEEIMADQRVPLSYDEQERIQSDLLDEVFGLGPLEPLLRDPKIFRHSGQRQGPRFY